MPFASLLGPAIIHIESSSLKPMLESKILMKSFGIIILTILTVMITSYHAWGTVINDFSQRNATVVAAIFYPTTTEEIEQIVRYAKAQNKQISVAGKRHSQGGHAFYTDALVMDLQYCEQFLK